MIYFYNSLDEEIKFPLLLEAGLKPCSRAPRIVVWVVASHIAVVWKSPRGPGPGQ